MIRKREVRTATAAWLVLAIVAMAATLSAQSPESPAAVGGDQMIAEYFRLQTERIQHDDLTEFATLEQWESQRAEFRRQLFEMLGLDPLPRRTPLQAVVTGTTEEQDFVVERLHFQSSPGLYVTANLYRPREVAQPLPAVLYVCGHGGVKRDGVSFGNKVHYHHHGSWFARNGYVCLTLDSLQLGEIEATHHGTYRYNLWWWLNRGYTPAGVEAWNCIRALDYLQSRPEVDAQRIGVTGRSGGGAYSWWIAALDDRIAAAVPVAGITDLQNHVVDGCVDGHCDCMYLVNRYRWDYAKVAALVAPRPLLISNTDRDSIFPLDGVVRVHRQVRHIYQLYGEADKLALHITAGPHQDTQELRIHAFRWFNHFLRGTDELIDQPARSYFEPPRLRVFDELPADQINTKIHESFVPVAEVPAADQVTSDWSNWRDARLRELRENVLQHWPTEEVESAAAEGTQLAGKWQLTSWRIRPQAGVELPAYVLKRGTEPPTTMRMHILGVDDWLPWVSRMRGGGFAFADAASATKDAAGFRAWVADAPEGLAWVFIVPRGIGLTAWQADPKAQTKIRRRFYLLGETLDGARVIDVARALDALAAHFSSATAWELHASGPMAGIAVYAALWQPRVTRVEVAGLNSSHRDGPYLLGVRRYVDMPVTVALLADRIPVTLRESNGSAAKNDWSWTRAVVGERLQLR